jgi:tetratricopeptide (TPR) repeat protein
MELPKSDSTRPPKPRVLLPVWKLLPAVGVCLVGAGLSIPQRDELAHRLDADGDRERVAEMAQEEREKKGAGPTTPVTDREKLRAWLEDVDTSVRSNMVICLDTRNMCAASAQPLELADEVMAHPNAMGAALRDSLLDALATGAIGKGKRDSIADGAAILDRWCRLTPSWPLAKRAAEAYGWADNLGAAVDLYEYVAKQDVPVEGRPAELTKTLIDMCLAANRPERAFELSRDAWHAASAEKRGELLQSTLDLASNANRTLEASALVAEQLSTMPFHTCPLADAVTLVQKKEAFSTPQSEKQYRHLATMMASWQWADNKGDAAFDTFLRLSLLGDEQAWHYCQELKEGLQGDGAYAIVLAERIAHGKDLALEPLLAEILAEQGETTRAIVLFRGLLAKTKKAEARVPLLEKLSDVLLETGEYQAVLATLAEQVRLAPPALNARRKMAFALVRVGNFEAARAEYAAISPLLLDDETVQIAYAGLCESLGHFAETIVAKQRVMSALTHKIVPDDYLELADFHRTLGHLPKHIEVLTKGLRLFPSSPRIRLVLAGAYASQGKSSEAVQLLAHESLNQNPAAIELLISEASQLKDAGIALTFLSDHGEECLRPLPEAQLRLAFLFEQFGRIDAAQRLFQSLLVRSDVRDAGGLHALAATCLEYGDANRAEGFQTAHLNRPASVYDSKGWQLLGDIYTAQQLPERAQEAYQRAVTSLNAARHANEVARSAS